MRLVATGPSAPRRCACGKEKVWNGAGFQCPDGWRCDGEQPKYRDPCRNCPGACGVACHWDDLSTRMPTPENAVGVECSVHPQCKGYEPRPGSVVA